MFFPGKLFLDCSGVCVRKEEEEDRKVVFNNNTLLVAPAIASFGVCFSVERFLVRVAGKMGCRWQLRCD